MTCSEHDKTDMDCDACWQSREANVSAEVDGRWVFVIHDGEESVGSVECVSTFQAKILAGRINRKEDKAPYGVAGTPIRPGGPVPGIGWVALYSDLKAGDRWSKPGSASSSEVGCDHWSRPGWGTPTLVVVRRWADRTSPPTTEPSKLCICGPQPKNGYTVKYGCPVHPALIATNADALPQPGERTVDLLVDERRPDLGWDDT